MKVHRGFDSFSSEMFRDAVATIGVFDGIHLGHRAVLDTTRDLARGFDGESVVVTFDTHPRLLLSGRAPPLICSVSHRLVLLERAGVDHSILLPFDDEVRNMSAGDFADRVFLRGLGVRGVVLGFDSRFGRDRKGDLVMLAEWAADHGIVVTAAPPVLRDRVPISSSVIRAAIARGEHELAQAMLGRPVAVYGVVVPGSGRGREIGFGTANLDLMGELSPPAGVYAAWARLRGRWRPALTNIGSRPTFDGAGPETHVEVHIPGVDENLYGEDIEVQFIRRIRDERRFPGIPELVEQIRKDREELDRIVGEMREPPE